jgi:hypothetical protein
MNIDDLKSKAEDVTPLEKEIIEKAEEKELTSEQKEIQEKFFRSAVVKRYKVALKNLYYVMSRRKNTIADVKQLILDKTKTLPFTASQREFIIGFKDEFLVACLKDIYNEKDLHAINLTISEPVQTGTRDSGDVQSNS